LFWKKFQQHQHVSKFHAKNKTMPKVNFSTLNQTASKNFSPQLSTFRPQTDTRHSQHLIDGAPINQMRKIPPKPPVRFSQHITHREPPEGMQQQQMPVTGEFQAKKNFQLAIVQQTHKLAREPLKVPINFNQQHLLPQNSFAVQLQSNNLQTFGNIQHNNDNRSNLHQNQKFHLPQKQQLVHSVMRMKQHHNHNVMMMMMMSEKQKSDEQKQQQQQQHQLDLEDENPENHIYEMIDEYEANGQMKRLQFGQTHANSSFSNEEVADGNGKDLFQSLLRAEIMNQMNMCSNSVRGSRYLSHLPQEKRMDVIQETALSLATAAYLEK
jgi:hypothetical protein